MKILLLPFTIAWKLVESMIKITGRLVAIMLGCIITTIGILLSLTIIGAILGIPMTILGITMIIRGVF